jgi:hypothetical protein
MERSFEMLPLIGFDVSEIHWRRNRFLLLSLGGISTSAEKAHSIAEFTVQFNRCALVDLRVHWEDALIVTSLAEGAVSPGLPYSHAPLGAEFSTVPMRLFQIQFNTGAIIVAASDFVCALVREEAFTKEDEEAYRIQK